MDATADEPRSHPRPLAPLRLRAPRGATVIAALAASALACILAFAAALGLLHLAHAGTFAVRSDSMRPAFARGDLIVTRPTSGLAVGKVITYRHAGVLVTHRIATVEADGSYRTRGDANPAPDPWTMTASDVVGEVRGVVPRAGYPLLLTDTKLGRLSVVIAVWALMSIVQWASRRATRVPSRLLHPSNGHAVRV